MPITSLFVRYQHKSGYGSKAMHGIANFGKWGGAALALSALLALAACGDDDDAPPDLGVSDLGGSDLAVLDLGGADLTSCQDDDGDGYAAAACGGDDCDDADASRYPGATEICDGDDEDCDPATLGPDGDGDGAPYFGCCDGPANCGADCDDARPTVNGAAVEACNGVDDDCDGAVDEEVVAVACVDTDGDGRGPLQIAETGCRVPIGSTTSCNDCDDSDSSRFVGATEACNGVDDDCDGAVDEGCSCATGETRPCGESTVGACRMGTQQCLGTPSLWESACAGAVLPVEETCDGEDNDCDGLTDEGVQWVFYPDCDLDGFGDDGNATQACVRPASGTTGCAGGVWTTTGGDCDDADRARNPRDGCGTDLDGGVPDGGVSDGGVPDGGAGDMGSPADMLFADRVIQYLKASNTDGYDDTRYRGDEFGRSISLSADGSTLAVGTPYEASNATGVDGDQTNNDAPFSGAVYLFRRTEGVWTQEAYIKASNAEAGDSFGASVALSADGSTLVVGATGESSNGVGVSGDPNNNDASDRGAVYIFRRDSGSWMQEAYLKPFILGVPSTLLTSGFLFANFGKTVAVSADGSTVVVGTPSHNSNAMGINGVPTGFSLTNSGAAFVFVRDAGGTWSEEAFVRPAIITPGSIEFGHAVAISADGAVVAVGAIGDDSSATGVAGDPMLSGSTDSGAVYVFRRMMGMWSQEAYIKPSTTGVVENFGFSLALSGSGDALAVGTPLHFSVAVGVGASEGPTGLRASGAAYMFRREPTTGWAQEVFIKPSNTHNNQAFGAAVSLSVDGRFLAVGSPGEASASMGVGGEEYVFCEVCAGSGSSGAVYVFQYTEAVWTQASFVKASNTGMDDAFGHSVALSPDGSSLAVGAYREDSAATGIGGDQTSNAAVDSGSVYVY